MNHYYLLLLLAAGLFGCKQVPNNDQTGSPGNGFPSELVEFTAYANNPVFSGTGEDTWDKYIRERGYILKEGDTWHMWYTGYPDGSDQVMSLGYAISPDGLIWTRYAGKPIFNESWTEDMMVWKDGDIYYMFAEGRNDIAHLLISHDRINWEDQGSLDLRHANGEPLKKGSFGPENDPLPQVEGQPLSAGPYGTPTVWKEDSTWYLFYERNDMGIWLATSSDLNIWTNIQDDPVIEMGPESYDKFGLAVNQIIKHKGKYYAYYHGTAFEDWHEWTTNVAMSEDLVHWTKYPGNPIAEENKSSGILVHDGGRYLLYTMHEKVQLHYHLTDP